MSVSLLILSSILQVSYAGVVTGRVTADDNARAFVDGILVASTSSPPEIASFTASDAWQLLAIHGTNVGGSKRLMADIETSEQLIYTDDSDIWSCSDTLESGWETLEFDDSSWGPPMIIAGTRTGMDPSTKQIWNSNNAGSNVYCRVWNPYHPSCDVSPIVKVNKRKTRFSEATCSIKRKHLHYTALGYHTEDSFAECAASCTMSATSCVNSEGADCLPDSEGCCGFTYDAPAKKCDTFGIFENGNASVLQVPCHGLFYKIV